MLKATSGARTGGGFPGAFTSLTATGLFTQNGEDNLTAHAGGTQAAALALSATANAHRITVCATAGDSVKLPAALVSQWHYIRNDGAAACQVFGQATETINGVASATGVTLFPGQGKFFICTTAAKWTTNETNAPVLIGKSAIPFISISTGSIAANGALTGITALPRTIAAAWIDLPANAVATVATAGFRYCTFSGTTTGTVFLDQPTSLTSPPPTSPTAVTDGKGAYVGITSEEFVPGLTVPANSIGITGALRYYSLWSCNNNANVKTVRTRFSGNAGTIFMQQAVTSQMSFSFLSEIRNVSATNSQVGPALTNNGGFGVIGANVVTAAVDTTAVTTLVHTLQKATATDNIILEAATNELLV